MGTAWPHTCYVAKANLELLSGGLCLLNAKITDVCQHALLEDIHLGKGDGTTV